MTDLSNAPLRITIPLDPNNVSTNQVTGAGKGFNDASVAGFGQGQTVLQYPLDIGKYIITFVPCQYNRQDLNAIGDITPDSAYPAIKLPLPLQMVDTNHVNWAEAEIGTLPAVGFFAGKALTGTTTGALAGAVAGGAGAGLLGALGGGGAASGAGAGIETVLGVSPNQFVTMLMRGPTYKRHRWTWEFSPNNNNEADVLRQIINSFKNAMAPNFYQVGSSNVPFLWKFPHIFKVAIYPNSMFMYKFKPCVCDYFTVNYMPGGRGAFYANPNGVDGNNPPEGVQIQMNLIELEYWIEGNYGSNIGAGSNDPADVYNNTPSQGLNDAVNNILNDLQTQINPSVGPGGIGHA